MSQQSHYNDVFPTYLHCEIVCHTKKQSLSKSKQIVKYICVTEIVLHRWKLIIVAFQKLNIWLLLVDQDRIMHTTDDQKNHETTAWCYRIFTGLYFDN